ncbi:hypothetical protein ACFLZD_02825, partial [Candidatus Neomarinimicrobiota bacterium]
PTETTTELKIETFTFSSNGTDINGKIYLPDSYEANANLPAIFLIDFTETEQVFNEVYDEFEKVIDGVQQIQDFDALVVTLEEHLDFESLPGAFQDIYPIFKDLASYVDNNYTNNTSRTFIGRGREAGIVNMTMFLEDSETSVFDNFIATDSPIYFNKNVINMIENNDFPQNKQNKKLHFSFSNTNDFISCANMITEINDAEYTWLQFESKQYFGDYGTTYPAAFRAGIKFIFSN